MVDKFIILIGVMVSLMCSYVKMYQIVHFQHGEFIVFQLYFNKAVERNNSIFQNKLVRKVSSLDIFAHLFYITLNKRQSDSHIGLLPSVCCIMLF